MGVCDGRENRTASGHILIGQRRPVVVVRAISGDETGVATAVAGELRVAIHEQQVDPFDPVRAIRVGRQVFKEEKLPGNTAGKTGQIGVLRWIVHQREFLRHTFQAGQVEIKRLVIIIGARDLNIVDGLGTGRAAHRGKLVIESPTGVERAKIHVNAVSADVTVYQVWKINERHLPPAVTGTGKVFLIISAIQVYCQPELLEVGNAPYGLCPFFRVAQNRQQQGGQNRNDRNDNQQFNQRKGPARIHPG